MLRLFDTARASVTELAFRAPGRVGLYVCGPTVYDLPHIGHGRAMLVFDVLRRYLEFSGCSVTHVVNVTDVDDKIIDRAAAEHRSERAVAAQFETAWWRASDAIGALRPTETPRASEYITEMVELVQELIGRHVAYPTSDGVYLEVGRVPGYGELSHQDLGSLRPGARVAVSKEKRSPADFALWKLAKSGEPSWPAPFGAGRPGWHTECVVMSLGLLGDGFDLHGGGSDLVFPHHENERAQAIALGRSFAGHWVHHGMVESGGQKMSKSLGNFTTLTELLEANDPRAYRLLVLQSSYRAPLEVTAATLADATRGVARLDAMARRLGLDQPQSSPARQTEVAADDGALTGRFVAAMDDDLDTPRALAELFDGTRRANAAADAGASAEARALGGTVVRLLEVLGLEAGRGGGPAQSERDPSDARAAELLARRDAARQARDFALADTLRDELAELGFAVEDGATGSRAYQARPEQG